LCVRLEQLYDHRFITTTSIGGTSVESVPQLGDQLSRSFDTVERRTKPKRATRSMPRLRQTSLMRRYRRRSESPTREFIESVDMVDPIGNQQQQQEAIAYAKLEASPTPETMDVLATAGLTSAIATSASAFMAASASKPVSVASGVVPESETTVTVATTAVRPVTPPSQLMKMPEATVSLPQTSITITAVQFLQQQQTIASLIRQQHDLKQIIRVLQEQQEQLMKIPSQINELKRQRAGVYVLAWLVTFYLVQTLTIVFFVCVPVATARPETMKSYVCLLI
jgi:hypothetical protein